MFSNYIQTTPNLYLYFLHSHNRVPHMPSFHSCFFTICVSLSGATCLSFSYYHDIPASFSIIQPSLLSHPLLQLPSTIALQIVSNHWLINMQVFNDLQSGISGRYAIRRLSLNFRSRSFHASASTHDPNETGSFPTSLSGRSNFTRIAEHMAWSIDQSTDVSLQTITKLYSGLTRLAVVMLIRS